MSADLRHYYLQHMGIEPLIIRQKKPNKIHLTSLITEVTACVRCPLHESRTQTVFSHGNPNSKLMMISASPNIDVKASNLLSRMLSSIHLSDNDIYITHLVKCASSKHRIPNTEEMNKCIDYLNQQIALVTPQLILVVGLIAAQFLLNSDLPLTTMRSKLHHFQGIPMLVSYHPDDLIHHPADKKMAYEDFLQVKQLLNA